MNVWLTRKIEIEKNSFPIFAMRFYVREIIAFT